MASASAMTALLGPELVLKDGSTVKTEEHLAGKDSIGIYFSAHWCGPCRGFTPVLNKWYAESAADKKAEIIFVSSDRDEASFKGYLSEMEWGVAIPFGSSKKEELSGKYKVRGIPTLVTVDAKTGDTITTDARQDVTSNPSGWPFKPKPMEEIVDEATVTKAGESKSMRDLAAGVDYLMIYFSAHWCGPCRGFTPRLIEYYNKTQPSMEDGKKFDIVFASSDNTAGEFAEYHGTMPWWGLTYSQRDLKEALSKHFGVEGIPTLAVVDTKTWKTVTTGARSLVMEAPDEFPWLPTPVARLSQALDDINDKKTVLLFTDKAESSTLDLEAEFLAAATKYFGGEVEITFAVINAEAAMAPRLRGFLGYASDKDGADSARCVLVDIPAGVKYEIGEGIAALSAAGTIAKGVDSVFSGGLAPKGLRD